MLSASLMLGVSVLMCICVWEGEPLMCMNASLMYVG
jgi:hypothetical protein